MKRIIICLLILNLCFFGIGCNSEIAKAEDNSLKTQNIVEPSEVVIVQETLENITFYGDSWMDNYYFKQEFQNNNNTIIAKCGAWAMHYVNKVYNVPNTKMVYIQFGLNDWQTGVIGLTNSSYMKRFLDQVAITYPNTPILVGRSAHTGIGYISLTGLNINPNCNKYSQYIKEYCDNHSNFYYVDTTSCLENENGWLKPEYVDGSTYHLTPLGYTIWFKEINKVLLDILNSI